MPAHLLIMYPQPSDPVAFDTAYRGEHMPLAAPLLLDAGGSLVTQRVIGPAPEVPFHLISDVRFPSLAALQSFAESEGGKRALSNATSISPDGAPTVIISVVDESE